MSIPALILAGSRGSDDPLCRQENVDLKAFIKIAGKPMIDHVANAVSQTSGIDHIYLCLPQDVDLATQAPFCNGLIQSGRASILPPEQSPAASAKAAWSGLPPGASLLITTADHPLLTSTIIDDFVKQTAQGVNAGFARIEIVSQKYPQARRTKLRFRDGSYSGCNLFFLQGAQAGHILDFWQNLESLRKQPLRMALKLGLWPALAYQLNLLTLAQILKIIARKSGSPVQAVLLHDPHAAIDVDKIEDLALVRDIFSKGGA